MTITISEDAFDAALTTMLPEGMEGGHYGEHGFWLDADDIKRMNEDPEWLDVNRLWTVVEGDDGEMVVCSGFHYVNRIAYLYTQESHNGLDVCCCGEGDDEQHLEAQVQLLRSRLGLGEAISA